MNTVLIITTSLIAMMASFAWFPSIQLKQKISIAPYWVIVSIGAFFVWMQSGWSFAFLQQAWLAQGHINPIRILILFFCFSFLSVALDETGFIRYVAIIVLRIAKGKGYSLFLLWYLLVSLLTIFTANDIVILTLTPFIVYLTRALKIHVLPYVVSLFVAANSWSMLFIVGNPTNLYLALSFGLDFQGYVSVMVLPTVISSLLGLVIMMVMFRHDLKKIIPATQPEQLPAVDFLTAKLTIIFLLVTLIYMIVATWFPYPIDLVIVVSTCLFIGLSVLVGKYKVMILTVRRLPLSMIPFFLSMAIFVYALDASEVTARIQFFLMNVSIPYREGFFSLWVASFMNNIPMSVWFSDILTLSQPNALASIYHVIVSSNLAALFTPFGALAGLMFFDILKRFQVSLSFRAFMKYGWIIGFPMLITAFIIIDLIL